MDLIQRISDVLIQIGTDMKNRLIASPPTTANQVLVSKLVDGQVVAMWDDAANLGLTGGGTPVANQLVFSELQNCTYANDTLTYTGGYLALFGSTGYQAVSDKPCDMQITWISNAGLIFYCGDNSDVSKYLDDNAEGLLVEFSETDMLSFIDANKTTGTYGQFKMNIGDLLQITIKNHAVTFTNATTGLTWTSPQSDYLANPKYIGVVIGGTKPLTIKAI